MQKANYVIRTVFNDIIMYTHKYLGNAPNSISYVSSNVEKSSRRPGVSPLFVSGIAVVHPISVFFFMVSFCSVVLSPKAPLSLLIPLCLVLSLSCVGNLLLLCYLVGCPVVISCLVRAGAKAEQPAPAVVCWR